MKPFTLLSTVQTGVSLDTVFNGNSPRSFPGLKQPMSNSGGASYGYINLYKRRRTPSTRCTWICSSISARTR